MAADGMIVMGTQHDADKMVKYTQPKVNASGGKNVGVLNKKTSKSTILSAPLMMTWGVNEWKDEASGQDKYSTEIVIQGYNSSLTMLGGGNSSGGIANDSSQSSNNNDDMSQISNDMDDEIPF